VWNRDFDNSARDGLLETLAKRTGVALVRATATRIASFEGVVFEKHNPNGNTPWVLPLGIYHRTRLRFGLQYCPDCIAEPVPYYRRTWRLAWAVMCLAHNRPLLDRCDCGAPVAFHRGELGDRTALDGIQGLTRCSRCRGDLRACRGAHYDLALTCAALEAQRICSRVAADGGVTLDRRAVEAPLFFAGLRQLLQIMVHGRLARELRCTLAEWRSTRAYEPQFDGRMSTVERLSVVDRTVLLALAGQWLTDWPAGFIKSCKRAGLTASDVCRNLTYVPYWLARVVGDDLSRGTYSPAIEEIDAAIRYLRNKENSVTKAAVSKLLGRTDVFRKRKLQLLLTGVDESLSDVVDD
jgi:TniQ